MTREEIRLQVAVSALQGVLEAKLGVVGEALPSVAVEESLRIADEFVKQWFGDEEVKNIEQEKEQKPIEKQDYSGLNDLERVIHRAFLCAGVENVPVTIIEETAWECLAQMKPAEWSEEDEAKKRGLL